MYDPVAILSGQLNSNKIYISELQEYNHSHSAKIDTNKAEIAKLEAANLDLTSAISKLKASRQ